MNRARNGWPVAFALALLTASVATHGARGSTEQPLYQLDGNTFVMFYDLPSRRFRDIRQALVARDFDAVRRDCDVSAQYLTIERGRTHEKLDASFGDLVDRFATLPGAAAGGTAALRDFDALFARAHWLLAQHFLVNAAETRNDLQFKQAGHYLIASAHHMERATLWSSAPISPELRQSLDELRLLANRMVAKGARRWAANNKPVRRAARLLTRLGEHLNRDVLVQTQDDT